MKFRWLSSSILFISAIYSCAATALPNVVTVGPFGADYTNPVLAVDSITGASRSNPYVVKVSPGRFNIGNNPIYLKPHVSLVGSGQKATYIIGQVDSAAILPTGGPGVINGADQSEIRHLTVINRYPGTSHAIHNENASPLIIHVTAVARGGGGSGAFKAALWDDAGSASKVENSKLKASGVGGASPCLGVFSRNSNTRIANSKIVAKGCNINNAVSVSEGGQAHISNSEVNAVGEPSPNAPGINNVVAVTAQSGLESSVEIRSSKLLGNVTAANVDSTGSTAKVYIGVSQLDGGVSAGASSDIRCAGVYNGSLAALLSNCTLSP